MRAAEFATTPACDSVGVEDVMALMDKYSDLFKLANQVGLREIQRLEAAVDEHALPVQHRPHRAVAHEDPLFNRLQETLHWVIG